MKMQKKDKSKTMLFLRRLLWVIVAIALVCIEVVIYCDVAVCRASSGRVYSDVEQIPHRKVGLLLGTNPKGHGGGTNQSYDNRIDATVALYEAGKIDRFIISRARTGPEYDEPEAMRQALLSRGVPDSILTLDGEGFHTNASVARAKTVFGVDTLTFVSQEYHNRRSIYMAKHNGMDAIGFNAAMTNNRYWRFRLMLRERGSRVKAVLETMGVLDKPER